MVIFHSYVSLPEGKVHPQKPDISQPRPAFRRAALGATRSCRTCRARGHTGGIWDFTISMAMTQEPIDWRYLPYIRPIFLGLNFREYPRKIWPELGTNVPPFQDSGIPIDYWIIWKHVVSKSAICGFTMKTAGVTIWWSYDITLLILNLWWFNSSRTGKPPVLRGNHHVYHLFLWATYSIAMFNKQRVTIGWYDIICLQYINDISVGDPILI